MIRVVVLVCIGFVFVKSGFSQDLHFQHYTVNDGLASSQVHDIIQDEYHRLWFSTDHGLSCYDGYSFKNYTTDDGLTDITLFKFYPDNKGRIWCTSYNKAVFYFSGYNTVFTPYKHNKILQSVPDWAITNSFRIDEDGSIALGFLDALGFVYIDKDGHVTNTIHRRATNLPFRIYVLHDKPAQTFTYLEEDVSMNYPAKWPAPDTSGNVFTPNGNTHQKTCYMAKQNRMIYAVGQRVYIQPPHGAPTIINNEFESISTGLLNDSLFWVGLRYGGVHIYNLKGQLKSAHLPGKSVTRLLIDHEKGYWISTLNDGVFHASNTEVCYYQHEDNERNWTHSLGALGDSILYIGYYNGDVAFLRNKKLTTINYSVQLKPAQITRTLDGKTIYYITDYTIYSSNPTFKPFNLRVNPVGIFAAKNDSVFFASYSSYIWYANGRKTNITVGFRVNACCIYQGKYIIGTNRGLYQTTKNGAIPFHPTIFSRYSVTRVLPFMNGLILGTKYSGVVFWKGHKCIHVNRETGLTENHINNLKVENDTVVWACTNTGINRITFHKHGGVDVLPITTETGLICNEVSDIEFMRDTVWVGTHQGLCSFPRSMVEEKNIPYINYQSLITGIWVNDKAYELRNNMELTHSQNRVEFNFMAVSFSEKEPLLYRYRLEGLEDNWNYTTRRSALYPSLPYGTYTFTLQVKGSNHSWMKDQRTFTFIILPPFWKTWWFFLTAVVAVLILIYLFFRFRILSYNRDMTRELLRQLLKRVRKKTTYVVFREQGKDIRISTNSICYVLADGNYIEIHTDEKKHVIRYKIGEFLDLVPDPLEYLRISRSCIIRLDKVQEKGKKDVTVCGETLPVGETYTDQLEKIKF